MSDEKKHLEPAATVIRKLGGIAEVARAVGVHRTRVNRWMRPKQVNGTGGLVPSRYQQQLLEYARATGKDLKPDDFFCAA